MSTDPEHSSSRWLSASPTAKAARATAGHAETSRASVLSRSKGMAVLPLLVALALGGCGARDCLLGIAHRDCVPEGSPLAEFPEDDAICRSYGLIPGTHHYDVCRQTKRHERRLTGQATDYGALQGPLLPNLR